MLQRECARSHPALTYIEAKVEANTEKYNPIVVKIDEVIVNVMTITRSRKSKAMNAKEETPKHHIEMEIISTR
ncbi:hypothetical protein L0128_18080 [candidate division KSB1 bacterium]|nr:hypothetical protein [candidate division KSB1 bacterium]